MDIPSTIRNSLPVLSRNYGGSIAPARVEYTASVPLSYDRVIDCVEIASSGFQPVAQVPQKPYPSPVQPLSPARGTLVDLWI